MARLQRWLKTLVAGDQFGASGRAHAEHALRQAEEATLFFWRGGVSRTQGVLLLAVYAVYIAAHLVLR